MNRERLIVEHLPYAYVVAAKYRVPGCDRDDLDQEAAVALCIAADRYQPERGIPFKNFAGLVVERHIITALKHEQRDRRRAHHEAVRDHETDGDGETLESFIEAQEDPRANLHDLTEHRARIAELATAMRRLTPLEREALGYSTNERPYRGNKTIDNAIQRAHRKLREAA